VNERRENRKRTVRTSVPAKVFGAWFCCPRCSGRSIIFQKREGTYSCRRCGLEFLVDWEQQRCYIPAREENVE
jgi:transcription elongation factor Elf1